MPIYLYVKTHNTTGLKYLGKTTQDPFKYLGSGTRWLNHIRHHGTDIFTQILCESDNPDYIKQQGIYYSHLWNVVKSNEWANLKLEEGDGGFSHINTGDQEHIKRASLAGHKAIHNLIKHSTPWTSESAKQASIKGNLILQRLRKEDPERFNQQYSQLSERFKGEGNHNYGKVWCICKASPNDKSTRIYVDPDRIPEGYIAVKAYLDSLKKKDSSCYGKMWIYNPDLQENRYIHKIDKLPDGWYKGRRMEYYQKKC